MDVGTMLWTVRKLQEQHQLEEEAQRKAAQAAKSKRK
jgi:hypothetical protein